jgi:hypothetical protein
VATASAAWCIHGPCLRRSRPECKSVGATVKHLISQAQVQVAQFARVSRT